MAMVKWSTILEALSAHIRQMGFNTVEYLKLDAGRFGIARPNATQAFAYIILENDTITCMMAGRLYIELLQTSSPEQTTTVSRLVEPDCDVISDVEKTLNRILSYESELWKVQGF